MVTVFGLQADHYFKIGVEKVQSLFLESTLESLTLLIFFTATLSVWAKSIDYFFPGKVGQK